MLRRPKSFLQSNVQPIYGYAVIQRPYLVPLSNASVYMSCYGTINNEPHYYVNGNFLAEKLRYEEEDVSSFNLFFRNAKCIYCVSRNFAKNLIFPWIIVAKNVIKTIVKFREMKIGTIFTRKFEMGKSRFDENLKIVTTLMKNHYYKNREKNHLEN